MCFNIYSKLSFLFFFIYAIETSTGLLAACTWHINSTETISQTFVHNYTDIQLRYMFTIYILATRAYKTKTKRTVKSLRNTANISTRHKSVTDANHF